MLTRVPAPAARAPLSPVVEHSTDETILMMIGARVLAAARENTVPESAVLMDDGATCNIRTTAQGRVPNTWRKPTGP
eukprot:3763686-Prymnesium_polylepis.1